MKLEFLSWENPKNLIVDVKLYKLKVNRDQRGLLVETLKIDWPEIYRKDLPFAQSYYSITNPCVARDEDVWHYHPTKQADRFVVIKGSAVFSLYDWRKDSKTHGVLNLILMGEKNSDENQFLLLIPRNVLHSFCVVSQEPCYLINYPSELYNPQEEGRVSFSEVGVCLPDGTPFSWDLVREYFRK